MSRLVYLAEPIDQGGSSLSISAATNIAQRLIDKHLIYRPRQAFMVGTNPTPHHGVEQVNRAALASADALIAIVPKGVPSVGVPREIEACVQMGTPWAVVTDHTGSFSLVDAWFSATFDTTGYQAVADWVDNLPEAKNRSRELVFAKVAPYDGQLPTRAHDGDAGFDLYAAEDVQIPYDQFRDVPCGVRVAMPAGTWARIVGRSSTLRNRGLLVVEGIIDSGYRGPLFAGVRNLNGRGVMVEKGERLAQLILMNNLAPDYRPRWASATEFSAIPHDGRGEAGFGSSGS